MDINDIPKIRNEVTTEIENSKSADDLENLRIKYLGKKGIITSLLKTIGQLPVDKRKSAGAEINVLKNEVSEKIEEKKSFIKNIEKEKQYLKEAVDVSLPGQPLLKGSLHPLTKTLNDIVHIFNGMGFSIETGPEIEIDKFNFEFLNFPDNHPARDMHDTFYINDELLLRTHTSPLKFIVPGKVFRCDSDLTHSPIFFQLEGFWVDENVTFADLKELLKKFLRKLFRKNLNLRFRPSFFPFTEPSAEVDIECILCSGAGCQVCKNTGWLEILGCGMIDPEVFKSVNYDIEKYQGFAFGLGIDRIAMLKHGIDNIRLLYENDIRFLNQF
jgi:phenylalanyl-tRNA synthetase alpha chain